MALDVTNVGAALALIGGAAQNANDAAEAANTKAGLADTAANAANSAASSANAAAAGAAGYAQDYRNVDADIRLILSNHQAYMRWLEQRVTTLEAQIAAMAGS